MSEIFANRELLSAQALVDREALVYASFALDSSPSSPEDTPERPDYKTGVARHQLDSLQDRRRVHAVQSRVCEAVSAYKLRNTEMAIAELQTRKRRLQAESDVQSKRRNVQVAELNANLHALVKEGLRLMEETRKVVYLLLLTSTTSLTLRE